MKTTETIRSWTRRIKRDAVTLWFVCKHPDTPLPAKALCAIIVAYALSPIDLIPDFIPILGYLDDAIVLPLLRLSCGGLPAGHYGATHGCPTYPHKLCISQGITLGQSPSAQ